MARKLGRMRIDAYPFCAATRAPTTPVPSHTHPQRLVQCLAVCTPVTAEFDRNLAYMMEQLGEDLQKDCFYPDAPAKTFKEKIASGEEPPLTAPEPEAAAAA